MVDNIYEHTEVGMTTDLAKILKYIGKSVGVLGWVGVVLQRIRKKTAKNPYYIWKVNI